MTSTPVLKNCVGFDKLSRRKLDKLSRRKLDWLSQRTRLAWTLAWTLASTGSAS